jgi:hypothetical protein
MPLVPAFMEQRYEDAALRQADLTPCADRVHVSDARAVSHRADNDLVRLVVRNLTIDLLGVVAATS